MTKRGALRRVFFPDRFPCLRRRKIALMSPISRIAVDVARHRAPILHRRRIGQQSVARARAHAGDRGTRAAHRRNTRRRCARNRFVRAVRQHARARLRDIGVVPRRSHEAAKRWLQTLDHVAIFLLIAGTYTPFVLIALRGAWGWSLFAIVWTLAAIGTVFELTGLRRFRGAMIALYIGMGWVGVIAIRPLMAALPAAGSGARARRRRELHARRDLLRLARPAFPPRGVACVRASADRCCSFCRCSGTCCRKRA